MWGLEHAHKVWGQGKKLHNVKLYKFEYGQRGFWNILMKQINWDRDETLQDHQI